MSYRQRSCTLKDLSRSHCKVTTVVGRCVMSASGLMDVKTNLRDPLTKQNPVVIGQPLGRPTTSEDDLE